MNSNTNLAPFNQIGLRLKNPIIIASGTFGYDGYGRGIPASMDLSQIGEVIPKTVTRYPRSGNPEPRWYPKSYREGRARNEAIYLNSFRALPSR
jgi:dihydroorotate dehydrogenase (NAD+) catalytic subunit